MNNCYSTSRLSLLAAASLSLAHAIAEAPDAAAPAAPAAPLAEIKPDATPAAPPTPESGPSAKPPAPAPGATGADGVIPGSLKQDFESMEPGEPPAEYVVTDGEAKFSIAVVENNKVLEMSPTPLVDGGVLLGTSIKGPATVSARVLATGKRRSHPRFGVGLHGAGGYRCLIAPARKEIQLMKDDAVVAQAPFEWKSGIWTRIEFTLSKNASGGSDLEARAWQEPTARPAAPQLTLTVPTPPGTGKASLWATPYSETPVDFDDIEVTPKS